MCFLQQKILFPTAGFLSGFLLTLVDGLLAGCGLGSIILALRVALVAAFISFALYFVGCFVQKKELWKQFTTTAILVSPLVLSGAFHLGQTATLQSLLGIYLGTLISACLLSVIYATTLRHILLSFFKKFFGFYNILKIIIYFTSFILFFLLARYLHRLHFPLALGLFFLSWLFFKALLFSLLSRITSYVGAGLLIFGIVTSGASLFVPVSLENSFSASEQTVLANSFVLFGRSEKLEDLIDKSLELQPEKTEIKKTNLAALPEVPGKSVVLISIDALRPDHLGYNGYKRNVSPNIDALASLSVVFNRAYSASSSSAFSIPSIHTGVLMEDILKTQSKLPQMLAERFEILGYKTIGLFPPKVFSIGPALSGALKKAQFGFQKTKLLTGDAQKDTRIAVTMVKQTQTKPVFLWVHFYDPHLPYNCHDKPFGNKPKDCYDAEIAYLDNSLKHFFAVIKELMNDPIIALTADHGEAFGEHGRLYHSTDLYDEQIRVPLFIYIPGVSPMNIEEPVSNTWLFSTLSGLAGYEDNDKKDLRRHIVGARDDFPVLAALGNKRAIVYNNHKLICNRWPKGPYALYDLKKDPGETINLTAKQPAKTIELLSMLKHETEAQVSNLEQHCPKPIILGRLRRPDAAYDLFKIASNPNSKWAEEAARLLALMRDDNAANILVLLKDSTVLEVANWAETGLLLAGKNGDISKIGSLINNKTLLGKWSAIALGRNDDVSARDVLIALLKDEEPYIRAQAALALGNIGGKKTVDALLSLLEVRQTRWAAIEALGKIGDTRAIPHLKRLMLTEPDESNIPRYQKALEAMQNQ